MIVWVLGGWSMEHGGLPRLECMDFANNGYCRTGVGLATIRIPSGELTVCYWKWPFIVDFPIKNGDFPIAMLVYKRVRFNQQTFFGLSKNRKLRGLLIGRWYGYVMKYFVGYVTMDLSMGKHHGEASFLEIRGSTGPKTIPFNWEGKWFGGFSIAAFDFWRVHESSCPTKIGVKNNTLDLSKTMGVWSQPQVVGI